VLSVYCARDGRRRQPPGALACWQWHGQQPGVRALKTSLPQDLPLSRPPSLNTGVRALNSRELPSGPRDGTRCEQGGAEGQGRGHSPSIVPYRLAAAPRAATWPGVGGVSACSGGAASGVSGAPSGFRQPSARIVQCQVTGTARYTTEDRGKLQGRRLPHAGVSRRETGAGGHSSFEQGRGRACHGRPLRWSSSLFLPRAGREHFAWLWNQHQHRGVCKRSTHLSTLPTTNTMLCYGSPLSTASMMSKYTTF